MVIFAVAQFSCYHTDAVCYCGRFRLWYSV